MTTRRQRIISIGTRALVALALLLVATGIYFALYHTRPMPERVEHNDVLPRVVVMEATAVPVARQWEGFGTARARFAAGIPAQVRGLVIEVPPDIVAGERVTSGQLIARLDDTDFRDEIDVVEQRMGEIDAQIVQLDIEGERLAEQLELFREEIALARSELDRALAARERMGATQREVDQARQAVTAASRAEVTVREQIDRIEPRRSQLRALRSQHESALRVAMRNLERARIVSPMDGVLQSVDVEAGETVTVDQRVARVVRTDRIEVPLRLPASARSDLAVGAKVTLTSTGPRRAEWSASIARIAPEDDERTRTIAVYVEVDQSDACRDRQNEMGAGASEPSPSPLLSPGQLVRGLVSAAHPQQRFVVPRRAIQGDQIRLVENGVVQRRRVNVDFHIQGEFPELGLPDSQWVVLAPVTALREGSLVIVDAGRTLADGSRAEAILPDEPRHAQTAKRPAEESEQ